MGCGGGGQDTTYHCALDEELSDHSGVQSYNVPCEPAPMVLTAGFLLSSWAA